MSESGDQPPLDLARILEVLDRHRVDYLLVGGVSCTAYGALRETTDFDCLPDRAEGNFGHLADAMIELHARLRVEGMADDEARRLPVRLDATMLRSMEISTWRTDAGDLDILGDMPARDGQRRRYEDLVINAVELMIGSITVHAAALDDVIASKEWAGRPKDREALPELYDLRARRAAHDPTPPDRPSPPSTATRLG
ncbi:MAG: hypothetical protein ACRDZQ_04075 [Acidimicrobiales bacterium]